MIDVSDLESGNVVLTRDIFGADGRPAHAASSATLGGDD
jgi:hypothetical protein